MESREPESSIRERLGVPADAERVIVFGESSHWDPNWLLTSKEYFRLRIQRLLGRALKECQKEPRRVYSVECVFFLKMYWDRKPDNRDLVRELVNEGRWRLTGSGVTTPDSLLPDTEAILRDYLIGQQWLRDNGMDQEPRLAYLPDDFGHSPALPTMLVAAGFDQAAVSRIDGMNFPGCDYRLSSYFPRPGSSAELLERELATTDFVWRGPDGAEVLCHWNAFTYFQGDMLDAAGVVKWMGFTVGLPRKSGKQVAAKIESFAQALEPLARTPYRFCPIGGDFVDPIPGLVSLLDRYNQTRYPDTGLYAVNAGLDDYLAMVDCHRDQLPALALDMNPAWMGFYSARPSMKQKCNRLARGLVNAEKLAALAREQGELDFEPEQELKSAWYTTAVSNHHDFITGTSPDRVWNKEQQPWLAKAQADLDDVTAKLLADCPTPPSARAALPVEWNYESGRLVIESMFHRIVIDESAGGCVTEWRDLISGKDALTGMGADLVCYRDTGGLWRMGHEYAGGVFKEIDRASKHRALLSTHEADGLLEVRVHSILAKEKVLRRFWFRNDSPSVRMRVEGRVGLRRTVTMRFGAGVRPVNLVMDVPGGVVRRPLRKVYDPTFWPAKSFVHMRDRESGLGLAAFLAGPASVSANSNGAIEWVAMRNAPKERAFSILPVLAHPAYGTESGEQACDCAVRVTPDGDWKGNQLYAGAGRALDEAWLHPGGPDLAALCDYLVGTDNEEVLVSAVKRAENGEGLIVRLTNHHALDGTVGVRLRGRMIRQAFSCDARERDLSQLAVNEDGMALAPLSSTIISVRLLLKK